MENYFVRVDLGLENWMILSKDKGGLGLNFSTAIVYARIFALTHVGDGVFGTYQNDFESLYGIGKTSFFNALKTLLQEELIIECASRKQHSPIRYFRVNIEKIKKYICLELSDTQSDGLNSYEEEGYTYPQNGGYYNVENSNSGEVINNSEFNNRTPEFTKRTEQFKKRTPEFKKRTEEFTLRTDEFKKRTAKSDEVEQNAFIVKETVESTHPTATSTCENSEIVESNYNNEQFKNRTVASTCENVEESEVFNNSSVNNNVNNINNIYNNKNKIKFNLIKFNKEDSIIVEKFNQSLNELIELRDTKPEFNNQIADALKVQVKRLSAKRYNNALDLVVAAFAYEVELANAQNQTPIYQLYWLKDNEAVDATFAKLAELNPAFLPAPKPKPTKPEKQVELEKVTFCLNNCHWEAYVCGESIALITEDGELLKETSSDLSERRYSSSALISIFDAMCKRFGTGVATLKKSVNEAISTKENAGKTYPYLQKGLKGVWYCQLTPNSPLKALKNADGSDVRMSSVSYEQALEIAREQLAKQEVKAQEQPDTTFVKKPLFTTMPAVPKPGIAKKG